MSYIYPELNIKIGEILGGCDKVVKIYAYPEENITNYPAAIFYPSSLENTPETTQENFKHYGYKLWLVIGGAGIDIKTIFSTLMPNLLDQVLAEFDKNWSFANIDGHRVWAGINVGSWDVSPQQNGLEVSVEIDLTVKMLTSL